eukprot:141092_1
MGSSFCQKSDDSTEHAPQNTTELIQFDWGYNERDKVQICKIVVLGEQSIVKTQLVRHWMNDSSTKELEIGDQIYNLQVWDVPSTYSMRDVGMTNIYCRHALSAIIIIDTTNSDALDSAQNVIISVKNINPNISFIILANKWKSTDRILAETDIDSFCKRIDHCMSWQKIETQDEIDSVQRREVLNKHHETIKEMLCATIRSNQCKQSIIA